MSFALYMIGFVIFLGGLIWGASSPACRRSTSASGR